MSTPSPASRWNAARTELDVTGLTHADAGLLEAVHLAATRGQGTPLLVSGVVVAAVVPAVALPGHRRILPPGRPAAVPPSPVERSLVIDALASPAPGDDQPPAPA